MLTKSLQRRIIKAVEKKVRSVLKKDGTGHDWYHIERVRTMAVRIARQEKANLFLVELMALIHELPDRKIAGHGNERKALQAVELWLTQLKLSEEDIQHVIFVVANQSYSASGLRGEKLPTIEGKVVQDADRLEALGAIGIARCFAYNGKMGRPIYDPQHKIRKNMTAKQYKKSDTNSINHFYEKLLKLKDLMNTRLGRKLARQRHRFMKKYLDQFFAEWQGER